MAVKYFLGLYIICLVTLSHINCLDNGLALTPPMGWLAWERYRCNIDCDKDPDNCISEKLFKTMADLIVSEGYIEVGYKYINIDDCWLDMQRDSRGRLQPDAKRFPSGIKALADYIHGKGLKFGIYENMGTYTCAGYPGITEKTFKIDAETFAEWGVDYVKLDGCYGTSNYMDKYYPEFGYYLNKTGRPMVYSCSWPFYLTHTGFVPDYKAIIESCNLWRNADDIQDSWPSVSHIFNFYGNNQKVLIANAGPGHFNDPDMLIIGNFGLSYEQSRTQMSMWAILASPLLMSNDLRKMKPDMKDILQNEDIIAVNQDKLGKQGKRIYKVQGLEIWARPIEPVVHDESGNKNYYSYGILFLNQREDGAPVEMEVKLSELGLINPKGYHCRDLYDDYDYDVILPEKRFAVDVNPSGGSVMVRCDAVPPKP